MTRTPPSAALVLGVFAGLLATLTILPTALPLGRRLDAAEQVLLERQVQLVATYLATRVSTEGALGDEPIPELPISGAAVYRPDGVQTLWGTPPPDAWSPQLCDDTRSGIASVGGKPWAYGCAETEGGATLVAYGPDGDELSAGIAWLVVALAAIVGLVTALGVLRALRPLSRISHALDRVGGGERGVRLERVGLRELDELIEGLNAAAGAMESREDAIAARIQVVHELARIVAHEVRNPLQSLELLTSLIATESDPEERRDIAHSIQEEIRALDLVVSRLLREGVHAKGLVLNRTRRSLRPIVQQVVSVRTPEAHRRGILLETGPLDDAPADIDNALMARCIENLVSNAIQAVRDGHGKVRISVEGDEEAVHIYVDDNGPGVPHGLADRLFDPDVTGREQGTGLGLAMAKGVLEAHDGYIEHLPSPLGGARFHACIPRRESSGE